jgi:hypothetical protein
MVHREVPFQPDRRYLVLAERVSTDCRAGTATCGARRAKAAFSQWVRDPLGYRSSRKQLKQRLRCTVALNGLLAHGNFWPVFTVGDPNKIGRPVRVKRQA